MIVFNIVSVSFIIIYFANEELPKHLYNLCTLFFFKL